MSGSVNAVTLVGNVGREVEVRFTSGGDPVATISLATSERWSGKGGEKQERTDWHSVSVFGKTAQFVRDYVQKGALLAVEGSIQYDEYVDKDGNRRKSTKIRARRVELLSSAKGGKRTEGGEQPPDPFAASDEDGPVPF
jgi:single-strand DNA-binding protein